MQYPSCATVCSHELERALWGVWGMLSGWHTHNLKAMASRISFVNGQMVVLQGYMGGNLRESALSGWGGSGCSFRKLDEVVLQTCVPQAQRLLL